MNFVTAKIITLLKQRQNLNDLKLKLYICFLDFFFDKDIYFIDLCNNLSVFAWRFHYVFYLCGFSYLCAKHLKPLPKFFLLRTKIYIMGIVIRLLTPNKYRILVFKSPGLLLYNFNISTTLEHTYYGWWLSYRWKLQMCDSFRSIP